MILGHGKRQGHLQGWVKTNQYGNCKGLINLFLIFTGHVEKFPGKKCKKRESKVFSEFFLWSWQNPVIFLQPGTLPYHSSYEIAIANVVKRF